MIQSNKNEKRFVLYLNNIEKIKILLLLFIDGSKTQMLQVKIHVFETSEDFIEYAGVTLKEQIKSSISTHGDIFLKDGDNAFMLRRPDTGEVLAFDEHGLIFIYTAQDMSKELESFGAPYTANQKLIYQFDHWHVRPAHAEQSLHQVINELGLTETNN